jgi:hypothetical protein
MTKRKKATRREKPAPEPKRTRTRYDPDGNEVPLDNELAGRA